MKILKITICLMFVILFSANVVSADILTPLDTLEKNFRSLIYLPKTGQINCWNVFGVPIFCGGTGQDGEYQNGLPMTGERFTDNEDGTVYDKATNLTWQKCSRGQESLRCSGSATTSNWSGSLSYCNTLNLSGGKWRLPNRNELASIIDLSGVEPTINNKLFPNTPSVYYWTSTTFQQVYTSAWVVNFGNGVVNFQVKTLPNYTRCVR